MAFFTNYATLSYNGVTTTSNTVTGEILETISVSKTALLDTYTLNDDVTYVVSLYNSGSADADNLTLTDDLGGYQLSGQTVYPLSYRPGSMKLFVDGVLQPAPAVTAGPALTITGLSVPDDSSVMLIYEAGITGYAPLSDGGSITNTVTVTGAAVGEPLTAGSTITAASGAELMITKSVSPSVVTANGRLTYTFSIENVGNVEAAAAGGAVLSDTFDPALTNLSVTCGGAAWTQGVQYAYDSATGLFTTMPGQLSVPAASYSRSADGTWSVVPGVTELTVTGTLNA
ncbi:MAG: hypothetical protein E7423_04650 [Ruminococcaceae bacterium]|jgi:uncharacterized repeat protein (TIGR01451 family)|nr:hypothetical protein [Oscillospiraceae bacterium]